MGGAGSISDLGVCIACGLGSIRLLLDGLRILDLVGFRSGHVRGDLASGYGIGIGGVGFGSIVGLLGSLWESRLVGLEKLVESIGEYGLVLICRSGTDQLLDGSRRNLLRRGLLLRSIDRRPGRRRHEP